MSEPFPHGFRVQVAGIDYQPNGVDFAQGAFITRWSFKCPRCERHGRFTSGLVAKFEDFARQRACDDCREGGE